jgi:hypothetical protein
MSELKEKWKREIKDEINSSESQALNVNEPKKKKWNSKHFKGTCRSCGKMGHKAANYYSKGKSEDKNKSVDLSQ